MEQWQVWVRLPFGVLLPPRLLTLGIIAAMLVGIIGLELRAGAPDDAVVSPTRQDAGIPPVSNADNVPDRQQTERHIAVILARPLFSPSRRPDKAAPTGMVSNLGRLTGVIVSPVEKSAIFAGSAGGKSAVVEEGGRLGEYVVSSIEVGAVTVTGPGGKRVLHPAFDSSPPPPKPVVPAKPEIPTALVAQFQQALRDSQRSRDRSSQR